MKGWGSGFPLVSVVYIGAMYRSCRGGANLVRYLAKSLSDMLADEQCQAFLELCGDSSWLPSCVGQVVVRPSSSSPLSCSPRHACVGLGASVAVCGRDITRRLVVWVAGQETPGHFGPLVL